MKALLLSIIVSLNISTTVFCQSAIIDSLTKVVLEKSTKDIDKIEAYNELAYQLRSSNTNQAKEYASNALKLSIVNSYRKGESDSYVRLGILARLNGNYDESRKFYLEALPIREKLGDKKGTINVLNNIALTHKNQGNYLEAQKYYEKGLLMLEGEEASIPKGRLLLNLGTLSRYLNKNDKALKYLNESYTVYEKLNSTKGKANVTLEKASLYLTKLKNLEEAEENYNKALDLYQKEQLLDGQAKSYLGLGLVNLSKGKYSKSLEYFDIALGLKQYLSIDNYIKGLKGKGNIYNETKKYQDASEYYSQALILSESSKNFSEIASLNYNIAKAHQSMGQHQEATPYFEKSLSVIDSFPNPVLKDLVLYSLSKSYYELGNYRKGFESSLESINLKDSLNSSYINGIVLERNVTLLQAENELLVSEQEKQQLLTTSLIIGILLLLSLTGITFAGYYQRQKRLAAEREIDHLLTDIELETTYARLEGQDIERKRIAQDLHDGLGSMLSTVKLYFGSIEEKIDLLRSENQEQKDQYEKATLLLDKACDEVRKVAHEMKSGTLSKFGLPAELESLATIIRESKKIEVELLTHQMEERLDNKIEIQLYRITQEIISNILKHAKASKITIELNRFEDIISLVIEDNGVGFDLEQAKANGGMGIAGIEARVKEIDGSLNMDTQIGRGTSISIDVPYENMD